MAESVTWSTRHSSPMHRLQGCRADAEAHRGAALEMNAGAGMTKNPRTIGAHILASEALNIMEKYKITSIVVVDEEKRVAGVVHLHDLWTLQLM